MKIGRNELCYCGSGQKYKKCCLPKDNLSLKSLREESEKRLRQRMQEQYGNKFTMLEGAVEIKMSEVILDIAEELLKLAKTKEENEKAIAIACAAWNLAVMFEPEEREKEVEKIIEKIGKIEYQEEVGEIIYFMIEKKEQYYSHINRIILDYELVGNKNNFHLNVISSIDPEKFSEVI